MFNVQISTLYNVKYILDKYATFFSHSTFPWPFLFLLHTWLSMHNSTYSTNSGFTLRSYVTWDLWNMYSIQLNIIEFIMVIEQNPLLPKLYSKLNAANRNVWVFKSRFIDSKFAAVFLGKNIDQSGFYSYNGAENKRNI